MFTECRKATNWKYTDWKVVKMNFLFRRKYKFTDKKQSKRGMVSSALFLVAAILLIIGIYIAYSAKGKAGMSVGVLGIFSFLVSISGFGVGLKSFKDENVFFLFPWIGTVGNAVIWIGIGAIILIGI